MKPCVNNTKHGFKPLSDPYAKYLDEESPSNSSSSYNYKQRKEINPGVMYTTLFCSGCGLVIEVISSNTSNKELHNVSKESKQSETENIPSIAVENQNNQDITSIS